MKLKKITAVILCIALLLLVLTGCGDKNNNECSDPDCNPDSQPHINFNQAFATFKPDTVMLRSGDLTISWADLYVVLYTTVRNLVSSYGMEIPWDEDFDGQPLAELVLEYSADEAKSLLTFMYGLEANNFAFTDQELATISDDLDELIETYGGKEALIEALRTDGGFYSFDVFEELFKFEYKVMYLSDRLYGEGAASFPDDKVAEFAEKNGFLMAMHILRLQYDESDDSPLSYAEEIHSRLAEQKNSSDFVSIFRGLMNEFSEDEGALHSFPNGYLFQHHDMMPEFSDATAALEIGGLSGIVETMYGYHIILRLPLDYEATPISIASEGITRSLRQVAATNDFNDLREGWLNALNVEFTPEFQSLDLATVFQIHQ